MRAEKADLILCRVVEVIDSSECPAAAALHRRHWPLESPDVVYESEAVSLTLGV